MYNLDLKQELKVSSKQIKVALKVIISNHILWTFNRMLYSELCNLVTIGN